MTIDEAITHLREVAEGCPTEDRQCAYQHDELADWLEELRAYNAIGLKPCDYKTIRAAIKQCDKAKEEMSELNNILGGIRIDHLRELVQAKKDGRLVVLPCKKGDVLWSFYNWPREAVYSFCVVATSTLDGLSMLSTDKLGVIPASDVGKTVFLTREEAEAALAVRKGGA